MPIAKLAQRSLLHSEILFRMGSSAQQPLRQGVTAKAHTQVNILVHGAKDADQLKELESLPPEANVVAVGTADELIAVGPEKLSKVSVLLNSNFGVTGAPKEQLAKLWPHLPHLKWVHATSAGVTHILWEGLVESDVILTNAKGTYSSSLAEYAMTACLYFAKRLRTLQQQQEERRWNQLYVEELRGSCVLGTPCSHKRGRKLGIIGYGNIGQASARLGQAFGMEIAALRRRTELSQAEKAQNLQVYAPEQVSELTSSCDYIITALPATPATEKFVSAEAISAMQPHAVFINLGRGSTVDEAALTEALKAKRIRGAALDVFGEEPLPESSPLWGLDNVLVSPHCADMTSTFLHEAVQQFVDLVKGYAQGQPLWNVCDKRAGY